MTRPDNHLAPISAMIEVLDHERRETLAGALHQHVHAPPTAAERRVAFLGLLARLLNEHPQPPERIPYVERQQYDERRAAETSDAPSSERLVERFGSWKRVCWAAWLLQPDGRKATGGTPYSRLYPGRSRPPEYTVEECFASIRACADALGRAPSSADYHRWSLKKKRDARDAGQECRIVRMSIILRLLAPDDAPPREKWLTARARALHGYHD
jgi:hypothetical protein